MNFDYIANATELLLLFIPGFISVKLKLKYCDEKHISEFDCAMYSIASSFIILTIYEMLAALVEWLRASRGFFTCYPDISAEAYKTISALSLGWLLGFIKVKVTRSRIGKWINRIFDKNSETYPSVWNAAMDTANGAWAILYLRNGMIYNGIIDTYTIDPNDPVKEILLRNYTLSLRCEHITAGEKMSITIRDKVNNNAVLVDKAEIIAIEIYDGETT